MSSFIKKILNPYNGKVEEAEFLDDYFGSHIYGVKFKNGMVYRESEIEIKTANASGENIKLSF